MVWCSPVNDVSCLDIKQQEKGGGSRSRAGHGEIKTQAILEKLTKSVILSFLLLKIRVGSKKASQWWWGQQCIHAGSLLCQSLAVQPQANCWILHMASLSVKPVLNNNDCPHSFPFSLFHNVSVCVCAHMWVCVCIHLYECIIFCVRGTHIWGCMSRGARLTMGTILNHSCTLFIESESRDQTQSLPTWLVLWATLMLNSWFCFLRLRL